MSMRKISFGEAIREAIDEEMTRDQRVFMIGEDIGAAGGVFKIFTGLQETHGSDRVIDSPISEAGIAGIGVGAAMTGMRPIVDIMFGDFTTMVMDQMTNQAAKTHYMSGGKLTVPMVLRTTMGAGRATAAQHSQSLHVWLSHVPGMKVVVPSTPKDAKGLLKSAIRDDNPVAFFEDKTMYAITGEVPDSDYLVPIGEGEVKREGKDITIVATSSMVHEALAAAETLSELDISAEIVDPRTMSPLDTDLLVASARKTSRALVVDEGCQRYGVTGEMASVIAEGAFYYLDAPVKRLGAMDVPVPFAPSLEEATIPGAAGIVEMAKALCGKA